MTRETARPHHLGLRPPGPVALDRRACLAALAGWVGALGGCGGGGGDSSLVAGDVGAASMPQAPAWRTAWLAAVQPHQASAPGVPIAPPLVLEDQTLRQVVRLTQAGDALRVRISNVYGRDPLALSGVHVAREIGDLRIEPETDRILLFGGSPVVQVPAGGEVWSDELTLGLTGRDRLAISLYVRERMMVSTWHAGAFQSGGVAPGNALATPSLAGALPTRSVHWLQAVEVRARGAGGVVVAFGDSITEGAKSTPDNDRRYTDLLDARLAADPAWAGWGVVNAGLGGNRLLFDGFGTRALDRFDRDVLAVAGVRAAIVQIGINDLQAPAAGIGPAVEAEELIKGLQELVRRGRQGSVRIILATLPPCQGSAFATAASESGRKTFNAWIRAQTLADGVLDLDAVLRDPAAPDRLRPAYDSGDGLHPNDAGMAAMAQAVDLGALRTLPT